MLRLYDSRLSGNAWKVRILLTQLGIPFERVTLDLAKGRPPNRRFAPKAASLAFPCSSSRMAARSWNRRRSCCISRRVRRYLPDDPYLRAEVISWLFFEQADLLRALALPRFYHMRGIADQMSSRIADFQEGAYSALGKLERLARHA